VAEELGWSAYAFSSLQGRTAALRAAVVVGVIWAVWHWHPLVQAERSPAWILWWSLGTIASRVLLGWLCNNTGKRVLAPALFHATQNVCWQSFPRQGSHYDPQITGLLLTGVAIAVVAAWGSRRLSR
jgi:membrane protease YdiL (CAAX protease family)